MAVGQITYVLRNSLLVLLVIFCENALMGTP